MAWNGSNSGAGASKSGSRNPARGSGRSSSVLQGLIAGGVVVLFGVFALYFFASPDADVDEPAKPKKSAITDTEVHTPAEEETEEDSSASAIPEKPVELPPQKPGETRNGYIMFGNGKLHKVNGVVTNSLAHRRAKSSIFNHMSENVIAGLLVAKPGDIMVGTPNYHGRLAEDFAESLKEPIMIDPEDSDEDKELKMLVTKAKDHLKQAMDRGEDIEKIILDTRKECQELARYKQVLQQDLYSFVKKEEASDDDVDTYVKAANKVLEDKGIAPINPGPIARLRLTMKEGK